MKLKQLLFGLSVFSLLVGTMACEKTDLQPKTLEPKNTAPAVDFSYTIDNPGRLYPLNVTFTNASVGGEQYSWEFGEDTTNATPAFKAPNFSTELNPTHQYMVPGDYVVTLTVTNGSGVTKISRVVPVYFSRDIIR